jgi:hypothetical protein
MYSSVLDIVGELSGHPVLRLTRLMSCFFLPRSFAFSPSRQISGPYDVSIETATLLKTVVSNAKFSSIDELIISVKEVGRVLSLAQPKGTLHTHALV